MRPIILFLLLGFFGLGWSQTNGQHPVQRNWVITDSLHKVKEAKAKHLKLPLVKRTPTNHLHPSRIQLDTVVTLDLTTLTPADTLQLKPFKTNVVVSYYADKFHGRNTASGQKYDKHKFTAAHKKLPFGTKLKVTNEANGKSVIVVVNDRGPFSKSKELDLSKAAFLQITRDIRHGLLRGTIEIIE